MPPHAAEKAELMHAYTNFVVALLQNNIKPQSYSKDLTKFFIRVGDLNNNISVPKKSFIEDAWQAAFQIMEIFFFQNWEIIRIMIVYNSLFIIIYEWLLSEEK